MADIRTEFKRIDNILLEDAGTNGAGDYMAQMSWILFLKYLDDLEDTRETEATFCSEAKQNGVAGNSAANKAARQTIPAFRMSEKWMIAEGYAVGY